MEAEPDAIEMLIERQPLIDIEAQKGMRFLVDLKHFNFMFDPSSRRPPWKKKPLSQLEAVVTNPFAIFSGLKRQNFEDGLCYIGNIDGDVNLQTGYVFAAFAKILDNAILFFDWEDRLCDPRNRLLPNNWRNDLGEHLWNP